MCCGKNRTRYAGQATAYTTYSQTAAAMGPPREWRRCTRPGRRRRRPGPFALLLWGIVNYYREVKQERRREANLDAATTTGVQAQDTSYTSGYPSQDKKMPLHGKEKEGKMDAAEEEGEDSDPSGNALESSFVFIEPPPSYDAVKRDELSHA